MNSAALGVNDSAAGPVLYMALELGDKSWKVVFGDGTRRRHVTVKAGDLGQLRGAIEGTRTRFRVEQDARVVSCYEAGRAGFWLHRYLRSIGVENAVVDSSSIEVNRRRRRAKTDWIDGDKHLDLLVRYHGGERGSWSVVHVPSEADEDARRLHRELKGLKHERLSHSNRIRGLLVTQGIRLQVTWEFAARLERLKLWSGAPLPVEFKAELEREYECWVLVQLIQGVGSLECGTSTSNPHYS